MGKAGADAVDAMLANVASPDSATGTPEPDGLPSSWLFALIALVAIGKGGPTIDPCGVCAECRATTPPG